MCPILNSQAVVFAAAMAVSGTVILLALRLHKSFYATAQFPVSQSLPPLSLRSCLTPEWKKREDKKKKRVRFAEDVVDTGGSSEEFRRRRRRRCRNSNSLPSNSSSKQEVVGGMPANRMALYNGILRDRLVHHRLAYCF